MGQVSIDIEMARDVVHRLRRFVEDAGDQIRSVGAASDDALIDTSALRGVLHPLMTIGDLASQLEERIALAELIESTGASGLGGVVQGGVVRFDVLGGEESLEDVRAQTVALRLVAGVRGLEPSEGVLSRADVLRLEALTVLMEQHADDPKVMAAFVTALGAEGTVQVPLLLRQLATRYDAEAVGRPDEDNWWDADSPMSARISGLQQQFMESFGAGLGRATRTGAVSPGFGVELAAAAAGASSGEGWGLGQIVRHGDYDAGFLAALGGELYAQEQAHPGLVWYDQAGGTVAGWRLGTDDDGRYHDPFVAVLEAMGRNPQGALAFLNPDHGGSEALARTKYLIQERRWGGADDGNALGVALDAAATTYRAPVPPGREGESPAEAAVREALLTRQTDGAWVASATVHFLAQRTPGTDGHRIGQGGIDSITHLLSEYMYDVDRTAGGYDPTSSTGTFDPTLMPLAPWDRDRPVGAEFARGDLNTVLREVLVHDTSRQHLAEAAAQFDSGRLKAAVDAWERREIEDPAMMGASRSSAWLNGYLIGNLGQANVAAGKRQDELYGNLITSVSSAVEFVPMGGEITSAIGAKLLEVTTGEVEESAKTSEESAEDAARKARQDTEAAVKFRMALALTGSARATSVEYNDANGNRLPWFRFDHSFDSNALMDPQTLNQYAAWVEEGLGGDQIAHGAPNLGEAFQRGYERGEGPA